MHQKIKEYFYKNDIVLYQGRGTRALLIVEAPSAYSERHVLCKHLDGKNPMQFPEETLTIVGHLGANVLEPNHG